VAGAQLAVLRLGRPAQRGFKLAPVDTNLFPGGFNNLAPEFMPLCVQAVMVAVEKICPDARGILLVPENHTRNTFYLQNVATLQSILRQAGMKVRIGTLLPDVKADDARPARAAKARARTARAQRSARGSRRIRPLHGAAQQRPLGRHPADLREHRPADHPAAARGLVTRRKSHHFTAYDEVASEFAKLIGIDPWLINPHFGVCGEINFHERTGEECLAALGRRHARAIGAKYREYDIEAGALRDREGRRRHLRHGHHDREEMRTRSSRSTASSATRWRS
jgi:glutamate--cysteine ligase